MSFVARNLMPLMFVVVGAVEVIQLIMFYLFVGNITQSSTKLASSSFIENMLGWKCYSTKWVGRSSQFSASIDL